MSENLNDTPTPAQPPQPDTPEFVSLVQQQLEAKSIKPKCPCGAIGWANFEIFPVPTVTITAAPNVIMHSALIHCLKCGLKTERNLNILGITMKQEERRVLTLDQVQQPQKPLIVTG